MDSGPFLELADEVAAITRSAGALFIVNDRADIARLSGADGVHVGQGDLTPADVRRVVGDGAAVGMSTHSEGQARAALETPIDYLAIGPVHETRSKVRPDPTVGLAGVARAASLASPRGIPVVAIGGITLERAPAILEAGASSVAVISDLLQPDLALRARQFIAALGDH
jgi:thiamine-phosphate pyrophosphorylase